MYLLIAAAPQQKPQLLRASERPAATVIQNENLSQFLHLLPLINVRIAQSRGTYPEIIRRVLEIPAMWSHVTGPGRPLNDKGLCFPCTKLVII